MVKIAMNKMNYRAIVLFLLFFIITEIPAMGATDNLKIQFSGNKVAADIHEAPLSVILEEIGEKAGIEILLDKAEYDRKITVFFDFIPLEEAIAHIAGTLNHAIVFGPDNRIEQVTIVGKALSSNLKKEKSLIDSRLSGFQQEEENASMVKAGEQAGGENQEYTETHETPPLIALPPPDIK